MRVLGIISFAICVLFLLVFIIREFKRRFISPALLFSFSQLLMNIGIFINCDLSMKEDCILLCVYLLGDILFLLFYLFFSRNTRTINSFFERTLHPLSKKENGFWSLLVVVAIVVSVLFFLKVGVNIFTFIISSVKSGANISEFRKAVNYTAGNGLTYQLRNFLIPIVYGYFILFEKGRIRVVYILTLPVMVVLLIGSGQRAGIVFFVCFCLIAILYKFYFKKKRIKLRSLVFSKYSLLVLIFALAFLVMTLLNGRDSSSGSLIGAVLDRFLHDNQYCSILSFRYIYNEPIVFGKDWLGMLSNILGEDKYVPVASIIHAQLYGSLEGTSPPCIWGSAYYNFGLFGVAFISLFSAFVCSTLYKSFIKRCNDSFSLFCYSSLFFLFGTWLADSPTTLINAGFMFVLIVLMVHLIYKKLFSHQTYRGVLKNGQKKQYYR